MIDVPRPRPPYLHRETTRHGKTVWYVRVDKGPRIRIRAPFGTPEHDAEYQAAIAGQPQRARGVKAGTLAWLVFPVVRMAFARLPLHARRNAGATVAQLEAIFGWQGGTMASLYTRAADRRRLAIEAMRKLGATQDNKNEAAN